MPSGWYNPGMARTVWFGAVLALVACGGSAGDLVGDGRDEGLDVVHREDPKIVDDSGSVDDGSDGGQLPSPVDAGLEDAPDAEQLEDAAPIEEAGNVEGDAAPDVIEKDSGPVGPPYANENVRCLADEGDGFREYRCEGMYAPRWEMRYLGADNAYYRCLGDPNDSDSYRAPCQAGGECRIFRKSLPSLYGTCVK